MHLSDLLDVKDTEERNRQLRRILVPYTDLIDVTGCEVELLVIAINQTVPRKDVEDLLDKKLAKALYKNNEHFQRCIDEVQWFHTHNLKYPDSRVKGQRIIAQRPLKVKGVLSSANLPVCLSWSHNSSQVNPAKFFATKFIWEGVAKSLLDVFIETEPQWKTALRGMGLSINRLIDMRATLIESHTLNLIPEEVSDYSKQIRVPYEGDYCALTPVVSHSVQSQLQQMVFGRSVVATNIEHSHPASVGSLVASLGGIIRVLSYPPNVRSRASTRFCLGGGMRGHKLFDNSAIKDDRFLNALSQIVGENPAITLRQRRQLRVSALRFVRKQLALWIAPAMDFRDSLEISTESESFTGSVEEQLVYLPSENLTEVLNALNTRFHQALQYHRRGTRYAYHSELILPIKQQFSWLLSHISDQEVNDFPSQTNSVYLYLKKLVVHDGAMLSNPYISGIPSLTALGGLMHNYQRKLSELLECRCEIKRGAWYIGQFNQQVSKKLPEPDKVRYQRKLSDVQRPGILDGKYADLSMDLVLELKLPDSYPIPELSLLQAAFPSRFAGGILLPPSLFELSEWLQVYTNSSELFSTLARLPRSGCWIYPDDRGVNSFEDMVKRLEKDRDLKPVGLGYIPLEEPQSRVGSIAHKHCFVEPCIGVVQCKNPIDMRLAGAKQFYSSAFWCFDISNQAMLMKKAF